MIKKIFLTSCLLSLLFISTGCLEIQRIPSFVTDKITDISNKITKNTEKIEKANQDILKEAGEIKSITGEIKEKTPEEIKPQIENIEKSSDNIIVKTKEISIFTNQLQENGKELKETKTKVTKMKEEIEKLSQKLQEAEAESKAKMKKMLQGIVWISIIGFGISIALMFLSSPKIGIAGALASISTAALAIGFSEFYIWIAIVGATVITGIVGYVIWEAFRHHRALTEVIETAEIAKVNMETESKEKVFGKKNEVGLAGRIQSKNTSSLVKREKEKLTKLWKITKEEGK